MILTQQPGHVPVLEQVIHLGLFVLAGLTLALAVLAILDRAQRRRATAPDAAPAAEGSRRSIPLWAPGASAALFFVLFAIERLYHAS